MPSPSQLSIATSSVQRLQKEYYSYHEELEEQKARVEKLKVDPPSENSDFQLKQEEKAIEETKGLFGPLRNKISKARSHLEEQIGAEQLASEPNQEEIKKANEVLDESAPLA